MKDIFKEPNRTPDRTKRTGSQTWDLDWVNKLNAAPTTFRPQRRDFFATPKTTKAH